LKKHLLVPLLLVLCGCPKGAQGLATASDTVAHALNDAGQAITLACQGGQIDAPTCTTLQTDLIKVATAGKTLDASIRANQSTTGLAPELNAFLDAFNQLNNQDLVGIKNPNTKIIVSTIIVGAESAVSVIAAAVGGK
jgi:hypothetical protein